MAEEVGDATPYATQYLVDRARWESERLRDEVRAYVCERLGDRQAVVANLAHDRRCYFQHARQRSIVF